MNIEKSELESLVKKVVQQFAREGHDIHDAVEREILAQQVADEIYSREEKLTPKEYAG